MMKKNGLISKIARFFQFNYNLITFVVEVPSFEITLKK